MVQAEQQDCQFFSIILLLLLIKAQLLIKWRIDKRVPYVSAQFSSICLVVFEFMAPVLVVVQAPTPQFVTGREREVRSVASHSFPVVNEN